MKELSEFKYPCFTGSDLPRIMVNRNYGIYLQGVHRGDSCSLDGSHHNKPNPDVSFYYDNDDESSLGVLIANTEYNFDIKINHSTPHRYIDLLGMRLRDVIGTGQPLSCEPVPPAVPPAVPLIFNELSREQQLDIVNYVLDGGVLQQYLQSTPGMWIDIDYLPTAEDGTYRKRPLTEIEKIDREIAELQRRRKELKNA